MKTRQITNQVCAFIILAMTPGAYAQAPLAPVTTAKTAADDSGATSISDDPIGDWIEKNADRFGLYVDKSSRAASKEASARAAKAAAQNIISKGASGGRSVTVPAASARASAPQGAASGAASAPGLSASAPAAAASVPNAAASAPAISGSQGSDPIQAFIINRVIDLPPGSGQSDPFSKDSMTLPSDANAAVVVTPQNFVVPPIVEVPVPEISIEKKAFAPPAAAAQAASAAAQVSAVMADLDFAEKCSGFATPTGFGTWGKAVIRELVDGNANSLLQGTEDLRRACPNYDFLTIPQKSHVWVNVLASMSFLESSCDPRKVGQGPNGKAAGLLQLHAGQENKAAPGCNRNDSRSPITSLQCTISIIDAQIKRTSALFSTDTHFGVLRPQGDLVRLKTGQLKRVVKARVVVGGIKELPFCQKK